VPVDDWRLVGAIAALPAARYSAGEFYPAPRNEEGDGATIMEMMEQAT
jgi:hypothetical protein